MTEPEITIAGLPEDLPPADAQRLVAMVEAELAMIALRASSPAHPVHVEPSGRMATQVAGVDENGEEVLEEVNRDEATPLECPDCRRLLMGGSDEHVAVPFLVCPAVPRGLPVDDRPCHAGCVVACGLPS